MKEQIQENLDDNSFQSHRKRLKVVWKVFFWFIISVGAVVFTLIFLITPHKIYQGDNELFQNNKICFSEKISYLFREPQVGDTIVFSILQNSFEMDYVGLVVEIKQEDGLTNYVVLSKRDSSNPWVITKDRIKGRIYFPLILGSMERIMMIEEYRMMTPTPIPLQLPVSGSVEYNNVSLSDDWIKFESKDKEYSFFHSPNLKEEANSYDGNVSFSLAERDSENAKYLEIFVKKMALRLGEDVGSVIYKDTGLSSVPTFQKVVINNSIFGFEITRFVDNFSRQLKVVYLPRENFVYSVSMRTPLPMKDNTYEEIFGKIIGSFRFAY